METNNEPLASPPSAVFTEVVQPANAAAKPWNYKLLLPAFVIGLILQWLFLPGNGREAEARLEYAALFDAFVLGRILFAVLCRQRGGSWLAYAVLMCASPLWISAFVRFLISL